MALILSAASGNFNATATWVGGVVPTVGDEARASTGHTITITANASCTEISNAGTGIYVLNSGVTLTANITPKGSSPSHLLNFSAASPAVAYIVGNVIGSGVANGAYGINSTGTGTLNITGNVTGGNGTGSGAVTNASTGTITITGSVTGGQVSGNSFGAQNAIGTLNITGNVTGGVAANNFGVNNTSTGQVTIIGNVTGTALAGVNNASFGTLTITGDCTASLSANAVNSTSATPRVSGSFNSASNGRLAVNASAIILLTTPTAARTRYALNGTGTFVDMFTADNSLGQANPTDVRSGVSYASGNLTGRLTVPARGSVALSVNYGPSMPFTATRSGTTATATLTYSYPLVVGDTITVTGASNTEWNSSYTIASVVSGTSVTFTVPDTHSATAGTGATMQTTGTAVLDPAAVASAVWGAASRTITGGLVDTVTTLTNSPNVPSAAAIADEVRVELATELARIDAPVSGATAPSAATVATAVRSELATELARVDVATSSRLAAADYTAPSAAPTVAAIRTEMDSNSTKLANLDATVSSRLASSAYSAAPTTAQIATAVEGSLLNEADGQAVLNAIVGAIGNTNLSQVSLVAAVRADLERTGGKLDSIPTTAAPTAAANATAVWSTATKEITGGTVTTLTNSPNVPSAASIASATRSELAVELARVDVATSSRLATSGYTAPPTPPTVTAIRQELDTNSTKLANLDATISSRLASSVSTNITAIKAKTDLLNTDRLAQCATTSIVGNLIAQSNS